MCLGMHVVDGGRTDSKQSLCLEARLHGWHRCAMGVFFHRSLVRQQAGTPAKDMVTPFDASRPVLFRVVAARSGVDADERGCGGVRGRMLLLLIANAYVGGYKC